VKKNTLKLRYKDIFSKTSIVEPDIVKLDASKKVIIFSDTHLDATFSQVRFTQLKSLIKRADVVVINGDFWADSHTSFDAFLRSDWSQLFPLLKQKQTYYIFGNHDMPYHVDERVYSFCESTSFRIKLVMGNLRVHVEHGHLLSSPLTQKALAFFEYRPRLLHTVAYPVGLLQDLAINLHSRKPSGAFTAINRSYKKKRQLVSSNQEYFVMGHTHIGEFDMDNRYINLGYSGNKNIFYIELHQEKIIQSLR